MISCIRTWHYHDKEDSILICEDQYNFMGDVLNIKAAIGRRGEESER